MKNLFINIAKWTAVIGLVLYTANTIRNSDSTWWQLAICLGGWSIAIESAKRWVLDQINGKKTGITRVNKELESIQEFFCESEILRTELTKFGEKNYDGRHHHHFARQKDSPECLCSNLFSRGDVLAAFEEFYGFVGDRHPERFTIQHDWDYDEGVRRREKAFRAKISDLAPIFDRLHKAEPKAFLKDHIDWLNSDQMKDWKLQPYLTWLIPSLKWGHEPVKTDTGRAAVAELEEMLEPAGV